LKEVGAGNIWLALMNDEIVGMIGLMGEDEVEIEPIIVKPDHRNKGIGKMLLEFVLEKAEEIGLKFLSIKPVFRNHDAIRLFHDMGFQNIGQIELFVDLREKKGKWDREEELLGIRFNY
jgi:N-acetylglutamate synthase-like GNAT family acetyltransferase